MSLDIYREEILEHYNNPLNGGFIEDADVVVKEYNPSCGDEIIVHVKFGNGKIDQVKFQGQGCAISLSSADILLEEIKNKNIELAKNLTKEKFLETLGIDLSPLRLKCALLSFKAVKTAIYAYLDNQTK